MNGFGYSQLPENKEDKDQQYKYGLKISNEAKTIYISDSCCWSAAMKDGSFLSAYERVGYHSCTSQLLQGFLDGSAEIVVSRWDGKHFTETTIREA